MKRFTHFTDDELRELGLADDKNLAAVLRTRSDKRFCAFVIAFLCGSTHDELGLLKDELLAALRARADERFSAYVITSLYGLGYVERAARLLGAIGNWPRMLRLVADELEGKRKKTDLTPTGENIVKAYHAAGSLGNDGAPPTLAEVKEYWEKLFGKPPASSDWTIRQTLKREKLPLRPDQHRGPRGPRKFRRKAARKN